MLTHHSVRIQSVSELTSSIRGILETEFPFVTVIGEISNLSRPYSGHMYFTLKDPQARLKAVMFKPQQRYLDYLPGDGEEVICRGRITVYEPRGDYQLIVDTLELKGAGMLQLAFEKLKNTLDREGLFAEIHKTPLPFLPEKISLITSAKGAAVHDFLKIAQQRFDSVPIEIVPVPVQGENAANEIIEALQMLNRRAESDVIVLCRGGGSIEDLWAFNDERLARAIFASGIPIVSAVGHEVDFTIADFVADLRAPTPTAAAELVLPDKRQLLKRVLLAESRMKNTLVAQIIFARKRVATQRRILRDPRAILAHYLLELDHRQTAIQYALSLKIQRLRSRVHEALGRLQESSPARKLAEKKNLCTELTNKITMMMSLYLERKKADLNKNALLLDAVSPLAVMGRGYSIARSKETGKVISKSVQVEKGDDIEVMLHEGKLDCRVTKVD